jgi:hypothetical protein
VLLFVARHYLTTLYTDINMLKNSRKLVNTQDFSFARLPTQCMLYPGLWTGSTIPLCTHTHSSTNNVYNGLIQTGQPEQQSGIPLPEETESVTSVGGIMTAPEAVDTNGIELSQLSQATAMQLSGSHSLHVTDEDGNPIQFTMQDGRQLQVTNTALYY